MANYRYEAEKEKLPVIPARYRKVKEQCVNTHVEAVTLADQLFNAEKDASGSRTNETVKVRIRRLPEWSGFRVVVSERIGTVKVAVTSETVAETDVIKPKSTKRQRNDRKGRRNKYRGED